MLEKYTEEYSKVKEVTARIAKLEEQKTNLQKEISKKIDDEGTKLVRNAEKEVVSGLEAQLQTLIRREGQLYEGYKQEEQKANIEGQAETRLTTLKREIETNRSLLDTYTQRQKEQELALSSSRPDNIKITGEAIRPTQPIGPQRNRNILVAFLVSLAAGVGLAFLLDYLDDSIRTSDDIGRHLGLPTLALIPHQAPDKRRLAMAAKSNGIASTALITLEDTRSAMAESYRHLRTSLLFSSAGKPPQTMLVTSSQPAEGKTTTAINTAITLAQAGAEVVLIDCDLRRPRLHSHFDLPNSSGLTNYLSGEKNPEALLRNYASLPKLKIITSGPIPPNPAELLSSNEMRNLLQFLRGNFKHVIIDSPPAISFTDAAILATLVDGVILVAMAGKSSIHLMRRFKQRLANLGTRIYGVVLNGIKADSVEYGYYGYGQTYSYYTAHNDDSTPFLEDLEAPVQNERAEK
ncbi:MAG: polysaccharide biosynthesis tyrosine autokinase [Acidobacteria bacterium]|nr:polysaccharide biosynthesis tyrosine autokinase [Acidobacteriota bacterium]